MRVNTLSLIVFTFLTLDNCLGNELKIDNRPLNLILRELLDNKGQDARNGPYFISLTEKNLGTDNCDSFKWNEAELYFFRSLDQGGVLQKRCRDHFLQNLKIRIHRYPWLVNFFSLKKDYPERLYQRVKIAEEIVDLSRDRACSVVIVIAGSEIVGNPYLRDLTKPFESSVLVLHQEVFEYQNKTYPRSQLMSIFD